MIPMPYILVNIVLGTLSLICFCITSAALLSRYPLANRYLPAQLRRQRTRAFVTQGLVLAVLSIAVLRGMARLRNGYLLSLYLYDLFLYIGLINSVVLAYQFLDKRYFLNRPRVRRRLLIAMFSVVIISAAVIVVATTVVGLFIIR